MPTIIKQSITSLLTIAAGLATLPFAPSVAQAQAAPGVTFTPIYSFGEANSDGRDPAGGLIEAPDGDFYGMTTYGGLHGRSGGYPGDGTVYKIDSTGAETLLYSFDGKTGQYPDNQLTLGPDGNFYGTTLFGGPIDGQAAGGSVFTVTPAGTLTTLRSFPLSRDDQAAAPEGVVFGTDGNIYGTTSNGGVYGYGSFFKLSPAGKLTTLHSFSSGTDGAYPQPLILGSDGNFYGMTAEGGDKEEANAGNGVVYKVTPSGTLTTLYQFAGATDGGLPNGALAEGQDGDYYGTTLVEGPSNEGTSFKITPAGDFTLLHSFPAINAQNANTGGAEPAGSLLVGTDGNLYGATFYGGVSGDGTLFQLTPTGTLTTLYTFTGTDGERPNGGLIQTDDGTFYGTISAGGLYDRGGIYSLTLPASTSQLVSLTFPNDNGSVSGGQSATGTVTISSPAPIGGVSVTLTSSNPAEAAPPATATVLPGDTVATFKVATQPVGAPSSVTIIASYRGVTRSAPLAIRPTHLSLKSVTLGPNPAQGGATTTDNRVTLYGNADTDTVVSLTTSNPELVQVPPTVTVLTGYSSRKFAIATGTVTTTQMATITATYNGITQTATLTVTPSLRSVALSPTTTQGGATTTENRLYLTGNAAADTTITLTSSNPAVASVLSTVIVQKGYSSHEFTITIAKVATQQFITITATSGTLTKEATLTVNP